MRAAARKTHDRHDVRSAATKLQRPQKKARKKRARQIREWI
jgi:hypothetical protein